MNTARCHELATVIEVAIHMKCRLPTQSVYIEAHVTNASTPALYNEIDMPRSRNLQFEIVLARSS